LYDIFDHEFGNADFFNYMNFEMLEKNFGKIFGIFSIN